MLGSGSRTVSANNRRNGASYLGNPPTARSVNADMRTLQDIKRDIDRLSDQRAEVLHKLSEGHDPELTLEHKRLDEKIADLWDEQRTTRASIRFGDRNLIIQRARHEERLSRAA